MKRACSTAPTMTVISSRMRITPNTAQPLPFTSARLRPKESNGRVRSTTITGAITAQIVSRKRPGTISSTKPMPMAMPATMPATISGASTGVTERNSEPRS